MTDADKPKMLYVTRDLPSPPMQGSHLRVLNVGRQLRRFASVTFLYVGPEPDGERLAQTRAQFGDVIVMPTINRKLSGWVERLRHKVRMHWPWYHAEKVSRADRGRFEELCTEHELVWFHTLTPADSLRFYRLCDSVIDLDDLNQVKFDLMRKTQTSLRGKIATGILAYKWRRWESKALERFSAAVVCSENDKEFLGGGEGIFVIPNGFEMPSTKPVWKDRDHKRIGFIGMLGYAPNADGMKWFADEVWPVIREKVPEAQVRIIGRIAKNADFSDYPGFEHLGFVEDTGEEFSTWSAMIVPLHFGGGTRLKIVEAFSKMCPVVSTPVGAHGLHVEDGHNILIREKAVDFAEGCIGLLGNTQAGRNLAEAGWELFEKKYCWDVIGSEIKQIIVNDSGNREKS